MNIAIANISIPGLLSISSFIFGAVVGSFLNVVILRLPTEGESIVFPPSHCPKCGAAIHGYDNIPLLSFLLLRGKCRACRAPISFQYPLV
ncbi:MAG TPA: prepilin peptidase, partial [Desulfobacteraceae bacterium]|nr:prepilin peptidase [Desulfobacteraceae bacterium]